MTVVTLLLVTHLKGFLRYVLDLQSVYGKLSAHFIIIHLQKRRECDNMVKVKEQYSHAEYLRNFIRLDNARRHINLACKVFKRMDFDAIAFTGVSGMLIGPTICLRLGKPMIVVRKGDLDDCHSSNRVEGFQAAKRYVIVDDFVGSGDTVRRIQEAVKEFSP